MSATTSTSTKGHRRTAFSYKGCKENIMDIKTNKKLYS